VLLDLERLPSVVATYVNGVAAGGGVALAIAGDVRWASPEARFRLGWGRVGLSFDGGISWRLSRLVGLAHAQRLVFEDPDVDAAEAVRLGIVHRVVGAEGVEGALGELLGRLALQAPGAVARNKALFYRGLEGSFRSALGREERAMLVRAASAEGREGVRAFCEGRPPGFA